MANDIRLKVTLVEPPRGYAFCLQRGKGGKSERLDYVEVDNGDIAFELTVTVRPGKASSAPDFGGPFVQGRPGERFFYVCVGRCSAIAEPHWIGRVKVPLRSITGPVVAPAMAEPQTVLAARYAASRPTGGPALASVPLLGEGWVLGKG